MQYSVLLPTLLALSVEKRIERIRLCGGVTAQDIQRIVAYSDVLAEHGDEILYRSKKRGETAEYFNRLADVVAVSAFQPGGITIFDQHYEVRIEQG